MVTTEAQAVARKRGKWSDPGVPHRGWTWKSVADLGAPEQDCEMCEAMTIRYVHEMTHPKLRRPFRVGVVCAGNMAQDLEGPRTRETAVKSLAARRERWLGRKWRTSPTTNRSWISAYGYRVTIFEGPTFGATIADIEKNEIVDRVRGAATKDQAKLQAFDKITALRGQQ